MRKKSGSLVLTLLIGLFMFLPGPPAAWANSSENKALDDNYGVKVYRDYKDLVKSNPEKLIVIKTESDVYDGYSLLPFGSREKAVAQAAKKAKSSDNQIFLAIRDERQTFPGSNPPPGKFIGGVYYVYVIWPVGLEEMTEPSLLDEIGRHVKLGNEHLIKTHLMGLITQAKDEKFANITNGIKDLVRANNSEEAPEDVMDALVNLVVHHDRERCVADLLKWSKYHKNPGVRVGSDIALIELGEVRAVEEILKQEKDEKVISAVQEKLI